MKHLWSSIPGHWDIKKKAFVPKAKTTEELIKLEE